jgi:hypothetical protein
MLYFIIYGIIAIWVLFDAKKRKNNMFGWGIGTLFIGPILLPFYFAKRNLKKNEVREGGTGWNVLKNFALVWTITMFIFGITGFIGSSSVINQSAPGAEQVGAVIGTGLGMGIIFLAWFVPMVSALIIGLFLKKSSVVEEGPSGNLKNNK